MPIRIVGAVVVAANGSDECDENQLHCAISMSQDPEAKKLSLSSGILEDFPIGHVELVI